MRVLVCGGRDYSGHRKVWAILSTMHAEAPIEAIIQGGATGADQWAAMWAKAVSSPIDGPQPRNEPYAADWKRHGKAAGPIRNQRMIDEGKPDMVLAFPGGRGTADMVRRAENAGIPVRKIEA